MPVHVFLAAIAVGIALPLALVSISSGEAGVFARRRVKGEKGLDAADFLLDGSAGERVIAPAFGAVFRTMRRLTPAGLFESLDRRIALSGLSIRAETVILIQIVLAAAAFVALRQFIDGWLLIGGGTVAAFLIPIALINSIGRERQDRILLALPQVIDQLRMSVEAGVGFEAAVGRAAKAGDGPLAQELRHTLQEMQIGASRSEALHHLADRNDVTELRTLVAAVSQSEDFGIPVAHVLRVQADELRGRRRQRAEERAMKIPVKMVFPLVLCIFPALMLVLLGPATLRIVEALL